ncbi:hypothetical protein DM01DRAFT_1330070 [Hesseltinella vesiculosa]|uniref:Uncharacterized protein n=1 Tax=Hesseltinella vesiculosa TaxID=101127 RepID=A0A1X2G2B8_9FUNG|nr:hypothetical protein DM01DRAFT_1330070 [Hesseltinella vesiculosa]
MEANSGNDLLSFQLPPKYTPGTDLMSKWILNDKQVINLIVKSIVGQQAENKYETKPTEWTNYTRSDVFYSPTNRANAKTLPPILIEVQYAANGSFFRRLVEYCLMIRKHHSLLPIVIAICIHSTTQEFKDLTYDGDTLPFTKQVHCRGWAQECYFISAATISSVQTHNTSYLDRQPLHPLAALGHFLIEQKPSILNIAAKDDPTIQLLYGIAKRVFGDEAAKEDARHDAISNICSKATSQFNLAMSLLAEDVPDARAQKRTRDCLNDGLELMDKLHTKYANVPSSSTTNDSTRFQNTTNEQPEPPLPSGNNDWQFVDNYRSQHGTKMDWVGCYQAGKAVGFFSKYTSMKSVQAAYYRANSKHK